MCSEDGTVHQYDTRSPGGAVGLLAQTCEIQDVAYHPNHPEHFVTADSDGQIYLHDARQAWTDELSDFGEASRLSDVAVMQVREHELQSRVGADVMIHSMTLFSCRATLSDYLPGSGQILHLPLSPSRRMASISASSFQTIYPHCMLSTLRHLCLPSLLSLEDKTGISEATRIRRRRSMGHLVETIYLEVDFFIRRVATTTVRTSGKCRRAGGSTRSWIAPCTPKMASARTEQVVIDRFVSAPYSYSLHKLIFAWIQLSVPWTLRCQDWIIWHRRSSASQLRS